MYYRSLFSVALLFLIATSLVSAESDYDSISFEEERDTNGTTVYDVVLDTNKTVTLDIQNGAIINLSFPPISNAKALYSEGSADISGYEDPSSTTIGTFGGITFFVTLYTVDTDTVIDGYTFDQPLVFQVMDPSISAGDHLYLYDTVDSTWKNAAETCLGSDFMENSQDGSITINVCHLTQFAVITPTASGDAVGASSSDGSKGWIAAVVVIPVFVVVVIIIVVVLGVRGSRSRGRHQDIELNKPTRASQPMAELESDSDSSSEEEKEKPKPTATEEKKPEDKEEKKEDKKKDESSSSDSDSSNSSDSE